MTELNIVHVDMDAFYAAVEQKDNPQLQGKPVIVGGTGLDDRGVVSTASYEARKYGVHSAMPIKQARKLCPEGVFLPCRGERYAKISQQIFNIMSDFTPRIEKISIDEAFLDLTGCHHLFGTSREIGQKIKKRIQKELDLVASIGIAPNKFLAKLASDLEKPAGFKVIAEDEIAEVLDPLPVKNIWGVGEKTAAVLAEQGIKTVEQLKKYSTEELEALFGKLGHQLYQLARGIDKREVEVGEETKSISHEKTFRRDLKQEDPLFSILMELSEMVGRRLRKKRFKGKTVFIKLRYDDFNTLTRQKTLQRPFFTTEKIYQTGKELILQENLLNRPVRLLGIGVSNLIEKSAQQLSLFDDHREDLVRTLDEIKNKYGEKSVFRARQLINKDSVENRKE